MSSRSEIIQHLMSSGLQVSEENISSMELELTEQVRPYIYDQDYIGEDLAIETNKDVIKISALQEDRLKEIEKKISEVKEKISLGVLEVGQRMNSAYKEVLDAASSEKMATGVVDSIVFDLGSKIYVDHENTNASIVDGTVFGIKEKDLYDGISEDTLNRCKLSCQIISDISVRSGAIEVSTNSSKRRSIYDGSQDISASSLNLKGEAKTNSKCYIELTIDKKSNLETNALKLSLNTVHPVMVLTSEDGIAYEQESTLPSVIINSIIPISNPSRRYIKVRFTKNKGDSFRTGMYEYHVGIKQIVLASGLVKESCQYQSNDIQVQKNVSGISMQTCCTFESKASNIDYYINVDDLGWTKIRPSGKYKEKSSTTISSVFSPGVYKSSNIVDLEKTEDGFLTGIESQYRSANDLKFFRKNLKEKASEWHFDGVSRYCYIILDQKKDIDIGNNTVFIGPKQFTGKFSIEPGLHKVSLDQSEYISLFNIYNLVYGKYTDHSYYRLIHMVNGEEVGNTIYGPINVKAEIEIIADAILTDIVDVESYKLTLINNELMLPIKRDLKMYMTYRESVKYVNSLKIKAVMSSVNGEAIPFIRRIILHLT